MLLFQILAAIWDRPGTAAEIADAIQAQSGHAVPDSAVEHHLQMLHGCGYLRAPGDGAASHYSLTGDGSALLCRLAEAIERTEYLTA